MNKFFSLSDEKQAAIIDGALITFGNNGYKKASVNDIATAAGISKSMIFHYFGTKKTFYLYLLNMCSNLIIDEINEKFDSSVTDFFDRIILSSNIKISVMKKHPAIISFLSSAYFEEDKEVKDDIAAILSQGEDVRNKIAFDGVDTSKFKDGIDIKVVMKMLLWQADGFVNNTNFKSGVDIEALCNEYYECMYLLKNNLYKEEFLNERN